MSTAEEAVVTRGFFGDVTVRAIDKESRTATFAAATENGVETYGGREYLRMTGADLTRYRKNPVILDAHSYFETGAVIGRAKVSIKNRELVAEVTFASTTRAEEAWQLVSEDFVRSLSVGFIPLDVKRLEDGESDGNGQNRIEGPARIVRKWELYEISVVPVPADQDALRRAQFGAAHEELLNEVRGLKRALTDSQNKEKKTMEDETKVEQSTEPATEQRQPAEAPKAEARVAPEPEFATRAAEIRAIAPRGMEAIADQCVLEGLSIPDARKRMLEESAKRQTPAGTPEPLPPTTDKANKETIKDVSDDVLIRSLCG